MLDQNQTTMLQRSHGEARVAIANRAGKATLTALHQRGSAKAFWPRSGCAVPELVFLNTSGGLTGGDTLRFSLALGPDAQLTATTQTAERAYAAPHDTARMEVDFNVGRGARLDWLPQETIIFENSHLQRQTKINLADDACCIMVETIVLGRLAMGENPTKAELFDRRTILRNGRPFWSDHLHFNAAALLQRSHPALLGSARCLSVITLVAPGAEDAASSVRSVLADTGCDAALSGWDGRLVVRLAAPHLWPLKQQMARILQRLRQCALPRVWQMNGDIG